MTSLAANTTLPPLPEVCQGCEQIPDMEIVLQAIGTMVTSYQQLVDSFRDSMPDEADKYAKQVKQMEEYISAARAALSATKVEAEATAPTLPSEELKI